MGSERKTAKAEHVVPESCCYGESKKHKRGVGSSEDIDFLHSKFTASQRLCPNPHGRSDNLTLKPPATLWIYNIIHILQERRLKPEKTHQLVSIAVGKGLRQDLSKCPSITKTLAYRFLDTAS